MNATILNGARIEDRCIIGAGSVVTQGSHITGGSLVLGIPGKIVRKLTESDLRFIEESYNKYLSLAEKAKKGGV